MVTHLRCSDARLEVRCSAELGGPLATSSAFGCLLLPNPLQRFDQHRVLHEVGVRVIALNPALVPDMTVKVAKQLCESDDRFVQRLQVMIADDEVILRDLC